MIEDTMLLNQKDIQSLVTMEDVIECVDKTFQGMGNGTVVNPTKVNLDLGETAAYPPYSGFMNAMPAYIGWNDSAGIKWAGGFFGERKKLGLPYITSLILLIDPRVGNFRAVMDGAFITNYRTGPRRRLRSTISTVRQKDTPGPLRRRVQGHTQTMPFQHCSR